MFISNNLAEDNNNKEKINDLQGLSDKKGMEAEKFKIIGTIMKQQKRKIIIKILTVAEEAMKKARNTRKMKHLNVERRV